MGEIMKPIKNASKSQFVGMIIPEGTIIDESVCPHYGSCIRGRGCKTGGLWLHIRYRLLATVDDGEDGVWCWTNLRDSSKNMLGLGVDT